MVHVSFSKLGMNYHYGAGCRDNGGTKYSRLMAGFIRYTILSRVGSEFFLYSSFEGVFSSRATCVSGSSHIPSVFY